MSLQPHWVFAYAASDDDRNQRNYRDDRELLYFEDRAVWLTAILYLFALAAAVALLIEERKSGDAMLMGAATVGAMSFALVLRKTGGLRHFIRLPSDVR